MGRNNGRQQRGCRGVDDNHDSSGGGVDIKGILQAADNDKPSNPSADKRSSGTKQRRRKKGANDESQVVIITRDKKSINEGNAKSGTKSDPPQVKLLNPKSAMYKKNNIEGSAKRSVKSDHPEITLLKPVSQRKHGNKGPKSGGGGIKWDNPEVSLLKQKLFEATRDLEKENNTRKMLENKILDLSLELKNVKEKLGEDKNYCIGTLKDELDFEQQLRLSVQNDLSKSNDIIVSERNKVKELEKDIEALKRTNEGIQPKLQALKDDLESEKALQHSIQSNFCLEKQKTQALQKRLQYEVAATVAVRMELKGKRDRITKLEEQLRQGRPTDQCKACKSETAEYTAVRMELQSANEKLRSIRYLEEGLKQEQIAAKEAHSEAEDKLVRKLRKELHESRAKLKNERRKNAPSSSQPPRKQCPTRSLSDWVNVAPTNNEQHAGLIPIIQTSHSMNMPPPIEASLPGSTSPSASPPSSALPSLFHFDEDDVSIICDKDLEQLHDELTFIRSAYDPDEIIIETGRVTHMIELPAGHDSEMVNIALTVNIPNNYPASGVLDVKASIKGSNCSHEVRKCAIDALAELEEICLWEAKANEGRESIHSIFSVASGWANTDWHGILSKELSLSQDKKVEFNATLTEICYMLIHTHHLIEADKIQCVKKNASKISVGGFIKPGKPGLILVEGIESDCDRFLEALVFHSKKVFHSSSTFKNGGKALRKVPDTDIDSCRYLPRKMEQLESKNSIDEVERLCEKLGLSDRLNDLISH
ncbi:hypothetical protein ACHAXR_004196 [Thalassiosira sp. AJA248-18]